MTQENQGKKTAGIEGVKSLTPPPRLALVNTLWLGQKATPVRRVWIPQPDTTEQRPVGIPVRADRARHAWVTSALEPEGEARVAPKRDGFRPGRSGHDAIEAMCTAMGHTATEVLDADMAQGFDRIDHAA